MKKRLRIISALLLALLSWEVLATFLSERRTGRFVDPELGLLGKPGLIIQGREGFSIGRINSHYVRGADFDVNDASKRRIVVLGDSYTEAIQVSEAETFVQTAQRMFAEEGRPDVQMINAGRSAKSPPYYIATGRAWMRRLNSDFAILQLDERDFTADFYDSSAEAYAKRDGDNFILIRKPPKQSRGGRYAHYSSVALRLMRALEERSPSPRPPLETSAFEKETRWFMREARRIFPHLAVVYIPAMKYHNRETLGKLTPLEVSLQAAAKAEGVPYLNMRPYYARYFLETKQPCHGFDNTVPGTGHINRYGHRLLGEELHRLILSMLQ